MKLLGSVLKELFWGFGKPKSKLQRRVRLANRSVVCVGVLYTALAFFPQLLFAHSYSYENYTIHSRAELPPETQAVLQRADVLLQRSELFSRDSHHHIFLCNSNALFNLFYLRNGRQAYAFTPATGNVFLQHGSAADDLCWKAHDPRRVRSMSSLVAHEVTHNLIRERLGLLGERRLETWKNEGYAEYISMHNQQHYERSLVANHKANRPGEVSARYRPYLKRVAAILANPTNSFEDLLNTE